MRDHELRARALLDLTEPMITRARESTKETDERAEFLDLVTQVEAIAHCFEVRLHPDVKPGKVLDEYTQRQFDLSRRTPECEPVDGATVRAKIDDLRRGYETGMDLMAAKLIEMSSGAWLLGPVVRSAGGHHGFTGGAALKAMPERMRDRSDAQPLSADVRRSRGRKDDRREREADADAERVLARQAERGRSGVGRDDGSRGHGSVDMDSATNPHRRHAHKGDEAGDGERSRQSPTG